MSSSTDLQSREELDRRPCDRAIAQYRLQVRVREHSRLVTRDADAWELGWWVWGHGSAALWAVYIFLRSYLAVSPWTSARDNEDHCLMNRDTETVPALSEMRRRQTT